MRKKIKTIIQKGETFVGGMLMAGLIYTLVVKNAWSSDNERKNARNY